MVGTTVAGSKFLNENFVVLLLRFFTNIMPLCDDLAVRMCAREVENFLLRLFNLASLPTSLE